MHAFDAHCAAALFEKCRKFHSEKLHIRKKGEIGGSVGVSNHTPPTQARTTPHHPPPTMRKETQANLQVSSSDESSRNAFAM